MFHGIINLELGEQWDRADLGEVGGGEGIWSNDIIFKFLNKTS